MDETAILFAGGIISDINGLTDRTMETTEYLRLNSYHLALFALGLFCSTSV
jgi:hypothetical protein